MNTPRIVAIIVLFFLIGSLSLACIGVLNLMTPAHSSFGGGSVGSAGQVEHVEGKVVWMAVTGSGMDFVLETANGQSLRFHCDSDCRASPWHLERHMLEHAETDVFYVAAPRQSLRAVAVD